MRIALNYKIPEVYNYKFGRNPKTWSLTQLHELYLKLLERYDIRHSNYMIYFDKVIKKLAKEKNGEFDLYHYINDEDATPILYRVKNRYDRSYKCYVSSTEIATFDNRLTRLDFVLNGDVALEMGTEVKRLSILNRSWFKSTIWTLISEMVEDSLQKKYQDELPPALLKIKIGETVYIIESDISRVYYKTFRIIGVEPKSFTEIIE